MKKITIIAIIITMVRCANPVGPTGGDKDITAPIIQKINITNEGQYKKINILFDENINTKGAITVSPVTDKKNIELEKHRNILEFKVAKQINSISLNDVISDVNENNIGKYPYIILGQDSCKYHIKYQTPDPTKDKIKGYFKIDSFYYHGNHSIKENIGFGGLKKINQWMYVYNDLNNNDRYDITENYYIQKIDSNQLFQYSDTIKDTIEIKLYPSNIQEVKKSINQQLFIAIYTQIPNYIIEQENKINEINLISHHDTVIINIQDTTYFDKQLQLPKHQFKIINSKIEIGESNKINLITGIFDQDTTITFDIPLHPYILGIKNKELKLEQRGKSISLDNKNKSNITSMNEKEKNYFSNINQNNFNFIKDKTQTIITQLNQGKTRDSLIQKSKYKYGKLIFNVKNSALKNLKIKLLQENKLPKVYSLDSTQNTVILISGSYKYYLWEDSNNNDKIDATEDLQQILNSQKNHHGIHYENIIFYNKETAVNSKLDNINTVE